MSEDTELTNTRSARAKNPGIRTGDSGETCAGLTMLTCVQRAMVRPYDQEQAEEITAQV